nr:uncharacterized protein LOC115269146 [Aedes albopictus]
MAADGNMRARLKYDQVDAEGNLSQSDSDCEDVHPVESGSIDERPMPKGFTNLDPPNDTIGDVYPMNGAKRGKVVIFNQVNFKAGKDLKRKGSDKDVERLHKVLPKLGFIEDDIKDYKDSTYTKMQSVADELKHDEDLKQADCLMVFILTHGEQGDMLMAQDCTYNLYEFLENFTPKSLKSMAGKPKLFIIQACRGTKLDRGIQLKFKPIQADCVNNDVNSQSTNYVYRELPDLLLVMSSHYGHYSFRCTTTGSWLIQEFCNVLESYESLETTSIYDVLTETISAVSRKTSNARKKFNKKKQIPSFYSTLTKMLYFDTPKSAVQMQSHKFNATQSILVVVGNTLSATDRHNLKLNRTVDSWSNSTNTMAEDGNIDRLDATGNPDQFSDSVCTDSNPAESRSSAGTLKPKTSIDTANGPNAKAYSMDGPKRGKVLIFNQVTFKDPIYDEREGTEKDVERLYEVLPRLGFLKEDIVLYKDYSKGKIRKAIRKLNSDEDLKQADCLMVVILTYNEDEDKLMAQNGSYNMYKFVKKFTSTSLKSMAGKPKLFMIQACSNKKLRTGVQPRTDSARDVVDSLAENFTYPIFADLLLAMSSIQGQYSVRDDTGSWFIQEFCNVIESCKTLETNSIYEILTRTNMAVSKRVNKADEDESPKKQIPCFYSTLSKKLYFGSAK